MTHTDGYIGVAGLSTSTLLAEAAIETIAARKLGTSYAVGMDRAGRVYVEATEEMPPDEMLMVCTRACDPDVLAENIREELKLRKPDRSRRTVVRHAHNHGGIRRAS